ncbi:GAF domain-containing protein [Aliterella atlantica]|uniref:GAF domain-containing protein n=1 Tax=Aliterella atlantica TaxID=1827278 RepID=UPI000698D933|nr:GAF domain-containing protein [Aliterella atlantica]
MLEQRFPKSLNNSNQNSNQASASNTEPLVKKTSSPQSSQSSRSIWQRLTQPWSNLNFQTKLTILLMASAALPVVAVTQSLVNLNHNRELNTIKAALQKDGRAFTQEYVLWTQVESEAQAKNLASLVQASDIDLSNPQAVAARRTYLQNFLIIENGADPETNKSFQIITDAQGRTIAQDIQILADDFSQSPALPGKNAAAEPKYRQVSIPTGINLSNIPIVKNALTANRPLSGMELLKTDSLQRLGLASQAEIGVRSQPINNIPQAKQPSPQGTYDIDGGKMGLVSMAVHPVKINNKLVGTVIVGALQNRNYALTDKFSQSYNVPTATVFAQDWRVATNVPYSDGQTRAVGTRVAREVADVVLKQGKDFSGQTNIIGQKYLTFYSPLYDHQKELNPTQAKPVGIAYIGQSLAEVEQGLSQQQLTAYTIGGGILVLIGLVSIPIANSFSRPLRRISGFAQKVGAGEQGLRLELTERQDEIGVLSQELNQMASNLESDLEARHQEAERARFFTKIATSRSNDLQAVFNQALAGAREILQADRVVIYRFNPDWSGYILAESVLPGFPRALNNKIEDACISQKLIEAYKKGRVVPTDNVYAAGFHPEHLQLMDRLQIQANLVTPIVEGEELYGLLIAHHCAAPHQWQQNEIDFLTQTSAQLGLILDRITSLEQTQALAERASLVKDITVKLAQATQAENIFATAVTEIRSALNSDRVVIYSFNDKWQGTVTAESVGVGFPKALGAKIDDPCFADRYVERYRAGRVQATNNIYKAGLTECHIKQLSTFAVQANLVAPILQGGKLLGLLIAHQCSAPRNWEQADIDLFSQLATQVGFALDRANLLEQQKAAKEFLQKRALTLLTEVDPLSKGDLTIRATVTEDEIGTVADSYNSTIGSLRKIVGQVQQAAIQVAATTTSNESSVQGLSVEALRQTQEIAAALEQVQQMSNSIRVVVANASQAEAAVQQANATVQAGDAAMNRTVDGIIAIRETVTETSKKVKLLGESSQKISKVVNLIGRFAAQTNLLALKASIEAARAGEEGRGFAVLADEVRALARQSADATSDIEALVKDIQTETNEVVAAMEAGTEQVAAGTRLVDETRQSLNKITAVSSEIGSLVAAIAQAAAIQSQASESVTSKMSGVAAIADKTSTEVTSVSASFKELQAVAQELQASVGQFKVN